MSNDKNLRGYCSSCGSYGGCSCGYDYQNTSCSPDYSPISNNNSVCPQVEGGSATGGNSSGNTSNVHVSYSGSDKEEECCCKNGIIDLLTYLKTKALDDTDPIIVPSNICIYGNVIPSTITSCTDPILALDDGTNPSIKNVYLSNDIIRTNLTTVSLCGISVVKFTFIDDTPTIVNNDPELRRTFVYSYNCNSKCCCNCSNGIAQSLSYGMLGSSYNVYIKDTLTFNGTLSTGVLTGVTVVAISNDVAIFSTGSDDTTVYYGVPTCNILKFEQTT